MKKKSKKQQPVYYRQTQPYCDVGIIIPVLNRFDLLQKCLDSIPVAAGDVKYQVIIFDNASNKEEADLFYKNLNSDSYRVIRSQSNVGFPRACNEAAKLSKSKFLFFLNSDIELHANSIKILVDDLNNDETIGVTGMKLIFPANSPNPRRPAGKLQHIGLFTNHQGKFVHVFIGWNPDHPKVNKIREVTAVTGAALMTRRDLWNKIGGFNIQYGLGTFEDVDYCLSIAALGYKVVVCSNATAYHHAGASAEAAKISYPMQYNELIFLQRWANRIEYTEWKVL